MSNLQPLKSAKTAATEKNQPVQAAINPAFMQWLLRSALISNRGRQLATAGFVLPTAAALLLVTSMVVGAMLFRTFKQANSVQTQQQQQVVYNSATPAIDRGKAKLEALFDKDIESRVTGVVPSETQLAAALINDDVQGSFNQKLAEDGSEYYTLPGETRLDLGDRGAEDNGADNAWTYRADLDGDGTEDATVAYSIIFETPDTNDGDQPLTDQSDTTVRTRADALQVRRGPYSPNQDLNNSCDLSDTDGIKIQEQGWFPDNNNTSILRKNFQINAIVIPDATGNRTLSTLEFSQERRLDRGNKWGAWFRNDLEIFPGPPLKWNGAMHTEGNLMIGNTGFVSYLVSSPASCLNIREASIVSVTERIEDDAIDFQGQFISGRTVTNATGGSSMHHLYNADNPKAPIEEEFIPSADSLVDGKDPLDAALNPSVLFTEDRNEARDLSDSTAQTYRDTGWEDRNFVTKLRMDNQEEPKPFVDDTYRADDRYGPKPSYNSQISLDSTNSNGDDIPSSETVLVNEDLGSADDPQEIGLDGYWERRAKVEGLKILVGQRLELGNKYTWGFDADADGDFDEDDNGDSDVPDVLYPFDDSAAIAALPRPHETLQRRTLRDNLAAVQAAAVYHYQIDQGDFPAACVAATSHFGTPKAIYNSIDFQPSIPEMPITDFFNGRGTNGWEFEAPSLVELTDPGSPLGKAMENLAHFAGDPNGAFPPVQDAAGDIDHPYRYLRMWGDFSNLRRVLESGEAYANLSIADKTYLHTTACTLGMLAYNISLLGEVDADDILRNEGNMTDLGSQIWGLMDGIVTSGNPEVLPKEQLATYEYGARSNADKSLYNPDDYIGIPVSTFADALEDKLGAGDRRVQLLRLIAAAGQVLRDRQYGFIRDVNPVLPGLTPVPINGGTFELKIPGGVETTFNSSHMTCDPDATFGAPYVTGGGAGLDEKKLGLAMTLCNPELSNPKYPSLYYIFPVQDHDLNGDAGNSPADEQPATEPYIADTYIQNTASQDAGGDYTYQAITSDEIRDDIALQPRTSTADWVLPNQLSSNGSDDPNLIMAPDGSVLAVPFLDRTFYNSRELMTVRTLDIDLDMLRQTQPTNVTQTANVNNPYDFYSFSTSENWLSTRGIVYAFREDALREDGLARPASAANCTGSGEPCGDAINMTDPDIDAVNTTGNGLTTKPVDYYTDPERRVHGFRLLNGATVKRGSTPAPTRIGDDTNVYGISFVSDNPVYLQGDFNLHVAAGTSNRIEEFTALLSDNYGISEFYGRENLDTRFARPDEDDWRPSEVLTDALTILSANFCEGSAIDLLMTSTNSPPSNFVDYEYYDGSDSANTGIPLRLTTADGCGLGAGSRDGTSFLGAAELNNVAIAGESKVGDREWLRENPADMNFLHHEVDAADRIATYAPESPVMFAANGNPMYTDTLEPLAPEEYTSDGRTYFELNSGTRTEGINNATETRMNVLAISGIVPSRSQQAYGGLHNFPRFIEDWATTTKFHFAGSLLQLNFSTYATGPFDQDAWEIDDAPTSDNFLEYYNPPERRWGYDVALQYAVAGPIAERFISAEALRSEFYTEPPANDPYLYNLCMAALAVSNPGGKGCAQP